MARDQVSDLKAICHPAETSYLPASTSGQSLHLKNERAVVLRRDSLSRTPCRTIHVNITSPTVRTLEGKSLSESKRWEDNSHEQDLVSLQPVRCLPIRPYVPCCQSPGLLETEHRVQLPTMSHPPPQCTPHTMTFPFRLLPFSSPLPCSYLPTTTTGPDLCSQRICFWPCSQPLEAHPLHLAHTHRGRGRHYQGNI